MKKSAVVILIACVMICPGVASFPTLLNKSGNPTFKNGNTLYVGGTGPGNYSNIQDAVDDASDGDTVFVFDDSSPYYENVVVRNSISLVGEDKDHTVIYGLEGDNVINISADGVKVTSFTIQSSTSYSEKEIRSYIGAKIPFNKYNIDPDIEISLIFGIKIYSNNNNISKNNIIESPLGILIIGSNNTISNNTIRDHQISVLIDGDEGSYNNKISDNIISNELTEMYHWGISIHRSYNNIISGNTFIKTGIKFYGGLLYNNTVYNNTVNGKPLVYLQEQSDKVIGNAGQIILVKCRNITIRNQEFYDIDSAIQLFLTDESLISGNTINSNNGEGILIHGSHSNNISDNIFTNNLWSINMLGAANNKVLKNSITNSDFGIYLSINSNNNKISENTIRSNVFGIDFYQSYQNSIYMNTITKSYLGISLDGAYNNFIYNNNLIKNYVNAEDMGTNNVWNQEYPVGGNYWDDFDESFEGAYDNNSDGIVDSPYNIPGGANSQDQFPLIKPYGDDEDKPNLEITSPLKRFLYFFNQRIAPFFTTIIIGEIEVLVNATDDGFGINKVEFYLDDDIKYTDRTEPYSWTWDRKVPRKLRFRHVIKIIVYDYSGNNANDEIKVWRLL